MGGHPSEINQIDDNDRTWTKNVTLFSDSNRANDMPLPDIFKNNSNAER